jgi:hypothetical protein
MSDITDLCQIIHRGIGLNFEDLADEIIAAGFHRDRTITTAEELDKCPPGTAVIDSTGLYALVTVGHQVTSFGVVELWPYEELLTFPVTVLNEGVRDE